MKKYNDNIGLAIQKTLSELLAQSPEELRHKMDNPRSTDLIHMFQEFSEFSEVPLLDLLASKREVKHSFFAEIEGASKHETLHEMGHAMVHFAREPECEFELDPISSSDVLVLLAA